jgi:8-oxo-dGTP diphosphatase
MGLVRIFNPRTASEAAVVVAMLQAHEIPAYLHNGYLASVLPGVMINAYNSQSVMVPEECAADALEMIANFRTAPSPAGNNSAVRNALELLLFGWFVPSHHRPDRAGKLLARFVAFHELGETDDASLPAPTFAVMIARSPQGIVLVFNRYRKVWELPGGVIDPGESSRDAAARELAEEAGCIARHTAWLGYVEVADRTPHFGAVFACEVDAPPADFSNEEIGAVCVARSGSRPRPMGECDAALLNRFG